jgi:hypothetical protein
MPINNQIWGFSPDMGDLGDTLAGGITSYMDNRRFANAIKEATGPDGTVDYNKVRDVLASAGDPKGAVLADRLYGDTEEDMPFSASGGRIYSRQTGAVVSEPAPKPAKEPSTLEGIRRRLSRGETLSAGDQQLYDDSLRLDPVDRLLRGPSSAPTPRKVQTVPVPAAPGGDVSEGPKPFPKDKAELAKGSVYNLPNGSQGLWTGTTFEILN